jgi:hypothetical protein
MDKTELEIFNAVAILRAHAQAVLRLVQEGQFSSADYVKDIRTHIEHLDAAHQAFMVVAPLPEEVQKAA